jgi:hypothetical protein
MNQIKESLHADPRYCNFLKEVGGSYCAGWIFLNMRMELRIVKYLLI